MFFYLKKESIYFFRIFGPLIFLLPFLNAQGFDPVTGERLDSNYKCSIHAEWIWDIRKVLRECFFRS